VIRLRTDRLPGTPLNKRCPATIHTPQAICSTSFLSPAHDWLIVAMRVDRTRPIPT